MRILYRLAILLLAIGLVCGGIYLISKTTGAAESIPTLGTDGQARLKPGADSSAPGNRPAGDMPQPPTSADGSTQTFEGRGRDGGRGELGRSGMGWTEVLKNLGVLLLVTAGVTGVDKIISAVKTRAKPQATV